MDPLDQPVPEDRIAIIGMAGRFPGARSVDAFWRNVREGVESVASLSDQDLSASGVHPDVGSDPSYVRKRAVLDDVDMFDAAFFGMTPREAEILDPQHRFFLECAWEALENAGYNPDAFKGSIGVYAGASGNNTYFLGNLYPNQELRKAIDYQIFIANDKDFLPTRVSYKLNLRGPSVAIQTGCSTSLVAVHMACQGLLTYQCDIALAGAVSINVPPRAGYLYRQGMILSPDGRCRAFDADAQGTVVGNGIGVVTLRRLEDALDSGDHIEAVIRGSAINNDGSSKVGFTAPGVDGQAQVIAQALAMAEVDPETVTYVEAHGTGTRLGDPIEIAALTRAFHARSRSHGERRGYCAIGSVKTNIGHLDVAAGVVSLIKVVLALKNKEIPPSLHFKAPNPEIDFAGSPFFVNSTLTPWKSESGPRRAGVSSFGIGGTNAHVIVEEAEPAAAAPGGRPWQLLILSARTRTALDAVTVSFVEHLIRHPEVSLPDVAFTLQVGRKTFAHRRMVVCNDPAEAAILLSTLGDRRVLTQMEESSDRPVVFMFSGQGTQYVGMAQELYEREPTFRAGIDLCSGILQPALGLDLRRVLYPPPEGADAAAEQIKQTQLAQPALFAIEYSLARLWMEWGVRPVAMIGHSLGEYVAACIAGVFSLEDALSIVARRGQLMQGMPPGAMAAVPLPEDEVRPLLGRGLSLAAVNGPSACVVSGALDAVEAFADELLAERDIECQRLHTSHAFHSRMMDPVLPAFTDAIRRVKVSAPKIPFISNVTGGWITPDDAQRPAYWARHLREPVRFAAGLAEALSDPARALLEVGPGRVLATLARQHPARGVGRVVLSSIRPPHHRQSDIGYLLETLGQLWLSGVRVDWSGFYTHEPRRRVPLPSYPFERKRFWIDPPQTAATGAARLPSRAAQHPAGMLHIPSWRRSVLSGSVKPAARPPQDRCCLVFADALGIGSRMAMRLRRDGYEVVVVRPAGGFAVDGSGAYTIDPANREDYTSLLGAIRMLGRIPTIIMYLWGITREPRAPLDLDRLEAAQTLGFYSLMRIAQAIGEAGITEDVRIGVVTSNMQKVADAAVLCPEKATLLGPCRVIPKEYPNLSCISIDIDLPEPRTLQEGRLIDQLLAEVTLERTEPVVAYRNGERWLRTFEPMRVDRPEGLPPRLREGGVYLVVGGLGCLGSALAEHLAKLARAKLVLTGRSVLPPREAWDALLSREAAAPPPHAAPDQGSTLRKIRAVLEMERLGAEVLTAPADVTRLDDMRIVVAQALQRFGRIDGIIHAAGLGGTHLIQRATPEEAAAVLAPKLRGALVLEEALRGLRPDFLVLCSSVTSIFGGPRQAIQGAANSFLDAFAQRRCAGDGPLTLAIDWDFWQRPGPPRDASPGELASGGGADIPPAAAQGLSRDEALEAWSRILTSPTPQIIVSKKDILARHLHTGGSMAPPSTREMDSEGIPKSVHPRPELDTAYVAPRDPIERMIADTWEKLFGIDRIGIHDDFFALGGDSLLAVQLISRLRGTLKVELPSHSLLGAPTVAALADLVARADSPSSTSLSRRRPARTFPSSLVQIKPGTERPLFLVHPAGGHVYIYHHLAACLDAAQPVFGLEAPWIHGNGPPLTCVQEMAEHYLSTVRAVEPAGPYLLGGSSFGGLVAFEIAHQLLAAREHVALLTMIDTPTPAGVPTQRVDSLDRLAYLISGDPTLAVSAEEIQHLSPDEQLLYVLRRKRGVRRTFPKLAIPELARFRETVATNLQALLSYVPRPYPGRVLFFRAQERDAFAAPDPSTGWRSLITGGVDIEDVPGNHITMNFPPSAQIMAERIQAAIADARYTWGGAAGGPALPTNAEPRGGMDTPAGRAGAAAGGD